MAKNKLKLSPIIFLLFMILPFPALAGNNSSAAFSTWPDTGQTKCYDDSTEIPCPAPGEPFYGQDAQYANPTRSYTVLGGGTMVQDNVTGLVWEMKNNMDGTKNYSNPNDADNTYTWYDTNPDTNGGDQGNWGTNDTTDFIGQLNSGGGFGGYTNWRLPTFKELASLVDLGRAYPAIDPIFSSTTRSSYFWSSTTRAGYTFGAWVVNFYRGTDFYADKSNGYYVRAVRGGQNTSESHYVDNGDGTVTDTVTCLLWQKATMDTKNGIGPDIYNWQDALAVSENLSLAGHSDWRLPDQNELRSLVDYGRVNPSIDPLFSSVEQPFYFWSSTTLPGTTYNAWSVGFNGGNNGNVPKSSSYYVRAVRGQQCGNTAPQSIPPGVLPDIIIPGDVSFGVLTQVNAQSIVPYEDVYIISHGWNPDKSSTLPPWEATMGQTIAARPDISNGNVLLWNWQEKAVSDRQADDNPDLIIQNHKNNPNSLQVVLGVPYHNVEKSGEYLAEAIKQILPDNFLGRIHLIGHSLGSGVVIIAAKHLIDTYTVNQITLLDSPWYYFTPGGNFLKDHQDIFVDNYFSGLGRPQGYSMADTNVWLFNSFLTPRDAHELAHVWYRSSVTNFNAPEILGDTDSPNNDMPYGFYWHDHQNNAQDYYHYIGLPYWLLTDKSPLEFEAAVIVDTANALQEAAVETRNYIEAQAIEAGVKIKITAVNAMNKAEDIHEAVADATGHANWVSDTLRMTGYLQLVLNSEARMTIPINIPIESTSLQCSYEFKTGGDPQNKLEAFLGETLVYTAQASDPDQVGKKRSDWIDVTEFVGKIANLTFRLSNPTDGPLGEIALDDIVVANISELSAKGDINHDGIVTIQDVISGLQLMTGIQISGTVDKGADINSDEKIGIPEVIYSLQKVAGLR